MIYLRDFNIVISSIFSCIDRLPLAVLVLIYEKSIFSKHLGVIFRPIFASH